jgi:hypothetical protein
MSRLLNNATADALKLRVWLNPDNLINLHTDAISLACKFHDQH